MSIVWHFNHERQFLVWNDFLKVETYLSGTCLNVPFIPLQETATRHKHRGNPVSSLNDDDGDDDDDDDDDKNTNNNNNDNDNNNNNNNNNNNSLKWFSVGSNFVTKETAPRKCSSH